LPLSLLLLPRSLPLSPLNEPLSRLRCPRCPALRLAAPSCCPPRRTGFNFTHSSPSSSPSNKELGKVGDRTLTGYNQRSSWSRWPGPGTQPQRHPGDRGACSLIFVWVGVLFQKLRERECSQ